MLTGSQNWPSPPPFTREEEIKGNLHPTDLQHVTQHNKECAAVLSPGGGENTDFTAWLAAAEHPIEMCPREEHIQAAAAPAVTRSGLSPEKHGRPVLL